MTLSKEARIGLLVGISVIVFFVGIYFLKGLELFSNENHYKVKFDNVQGLQPSAQIQLKGLQVGKVAKIELDGAQVLVTLRISKKTSFPINTIAKLTSLDLLGTKGISLELGSSSTPAPDGHELAGAIEGGIIDKVSSEITPLLQDVRKVVLVVDSVLTGVNGVLNEQTRADLQSSVAALHTSMDNFSSLSANLNRESAQLASVIRNANSISTNLANNNDNIQRILTNFNSISDQLSSAPIQQTFTQLNTAATQIQQLMTRINSGDGSLGQLVNDRGLYDNLNSTLKKLTELSADLKAHPSRYINVTIFGRKRQVGD